MKLDKGNYSSPRWTYEVLDCAMPMTFDTYSNCAHQCLYCFSFFQRAIGASADDYLSHKVRAVNVERVKKMFTNPDEYGGQFKNYIKRRMVMQWGGLSDGFDWYEKKFGVSLELLKFFREIDYPISISTKGVWWVYDDRYRDVVRGAKNMHWKFSIITSDEEHVKKLEPGVPTAKARFDAMRELNNLGVGATTLRFRPFIIGTSDKHIEDMMKSAEDSGCISVTTEFLTWESRASNSSRQRLDAMSSILGYDVWKFYIENSARASGLLRLNYDLKRPYILQMKESAERHHLKFFVSDAHHKEKSYHSGCCGLPDSGPLSNFNRGQYAEAIKLAKEKGFVKWSDISEEAKRLLTDIPAIGAEGFPSDSAERAKRYYQSMYDYMHDIWNKPTSWQSPARYFGGALVPSAPDENGDIIYLYNKPFVELNIRVKSVNELAQYLRLAGKPNADRFDEITSDGAQYGHIAFPIVIFSRGRAGIATTPVLLDNARISNWFFAVPQTEVEEYIDAYPNADIIGLPYEEPYNSAMTIGKFRNEIFLHFRNLGYPFVWMLDDDIVSTSKPIRSIMSSVERLVTDYENVCVAGVAENDNDKSFVVNAEPRAFILVNLETGITFPDYGVYEDIAFQLECLSKGNWVTVLYSDGIFSRNQMLPGGNSSSYINGMQETIAELLHKQYEICTSLEKMPKPFGKKLIVDWSYFQNSIRSKAVKEIVK